jgi:histidine triad (HIT) family protein
MRTIRAFLLHIARSCIGPSIIGWVFTYMSFALPVKRLRETGSLIAFRHPQPGYPVHILLVPKKAIGSLADLTPADADFLADLIPAVQSLVAEFGLEQAGYRLMVNGGPYQDVAQLHFHLISGSEGQAVQLRPMTSSG